MNTTNANLYAVDCLVNMLGRFAGVRVTRKVRADNRFDAVLVALKNPAVRFAVSARRI